MKKLMSSMFLMSVLFVATSAVQAGGFDDDFGDWVIVEKDPVLPSTAEQNTFWNSLPNTPTTQKIRNLVNKAVAAVEKAKVVKFHAQQLAQQAKTEWQRANVTLQGLYASAKTAPTKLRNIANQLRENVKRVEKYIKASQESLQTLKSISPETYQSTISFLESLRSSTEFFSSLADKLDNLADIVAPQLNV